MNNSVLPLDAAPAVRVALPASRGWREFAVYFAGALGGLAVDAGTLVLLVQVFGIAPLPAAAVAFLAGTFVVYAISVSFAFDYRRVRNPGSEFTCFALIGLAGLCVTLLVMWLGVDELHVDYRLAKVVAAGASFITNYGLRKVILFTAS